MKQTIPRDRGTVIVSNKQGKILFVSKNNIKFVLPGGSVEKDESSFESAIRELREETGLIPKKAQELFKYKSNILYTENNKIYSTTHTVLLIEVKNYNLRLGDDAKYKYWINPVNIAKFDNEKSYILKSHIKIINKYLNIKKR